jgi:threonine/homoserine efflux transporter RhtA
MHVRHASHSKGRPRSLTCGWPGQPQGFAFAFGNCPLFRLYVVLEHRIAHTSTGSDAMSGIDQLRAAMLIAAMVVTPVGLGGALPAFVDAHVRGRS